MSTQPAFIIHCLTDRWMKQIRPNNINATFYVIGKVTNLNNTDMITSTTGNGSQRFLLCTLHNNIYDEGKPCPDCQAAAQNHINNGTVQPLNGTKER